LVHGRTARQQGGTPKSREITGRRADKAGALHRDARFRTSKQKTLTVAPWRVHWGHGGERHPYVLANPFAHSQSSPRRWATRAIAKVVSERPCLSALRQAPHRISSLLRCPAIGCIATSRSGIAVCTTDRREGWPVGSPPLHESSSSSFVVAALRRTERIQWSKPGWSTCRRRNRARAGRTCSFATRHVQPGKPEPDRDPHDLTTSTQASFYYYYGDPFTISDEGLVSGSRSRPSSPHVLPTRSQDDPST